MAVGFAVLFNLALAVSFVWPGMAAGWLVRAIWVGVILAWSISFWLTWRQQESAAPPKSTPAADDDTLFIQAQTEYLKGDWAAAEQRLVRGLKRDPRDLESRLLLATVLRRSGRAEAARHQLDTLRKIDGWQHWQPETESELRLLQSRSETDVSATAATGVEPVRSESGNTITMKPDTGPSPLTGHPTPIRTRNAA